MVTASLVFAVVVLVFFSWWAFSRRDRTPRSVQQARRTGAADRGASEFFGVLGGLIGGLVGCVVAIVVGFVGLYIVIWLIKRMWEAA